MSNMVVRTNVMSLNSHRNLSNTGTAQRNASARLSSGFRINSAADDAAGLGISEKMRAQIRGLDQASRNAQDGISLIQTAEGAMATVNEMVIRIRELVVQAANDTNVHNVEGGTVLENAIGMANSDRVRIQDEIDQLMAEIDAIAERTEFNTRTLLDGSLGDGAIGGSAAVVAVPGLGGIAAILGTTGAGFSGTLTEFINQEITAGNFSLGAHANVGDWLASGGSLVGLEEVDGGTALLEEFAQMNGQTWTQMRTAADTAAAAATATMTELLAINVTQAQSLESAILGALQGMTQPALDAVNTSLGLAAGAGFYISTHATDLTGQLRFGVAADAAGTTAANTGNVATAITTAFGAGAETGANGNALAGLASVPGLAPALNAWANNFSSQTTGANAIPEGLRAGLNAATNFADWIELAGNGIAGSAEVAATDGTPLWFQIGANVSQGVNLSINAVNVAALSAIGENMPGGGVGQFTFAALRSEGEGMDRTGGVLRRDGESIGEFLSALDLALAHTTAERSNLGAMQNRLEFAINNLDIASENLSAANSRIRDADMALEMMRLTQANVLQQAATSMLAQANQGPQQILQLLG